MTNAVSQTDTAVVLRVVDRVKTRGFMFAARPVGSSECITSREEHDRHERARKVRQTDVMISMSAIVTTKNEAVEPRA